jgi:hypothetical protein
MAFPKRSSAPAPKPTASKPAVTRHGAQPGRVSDAPKPKAVPKHTGNAERARGEFY